MNDASSPTSPPVYALPPALNTGSHDGDDEAADHDETASVRSVRSTTTGVDSPSHHHEGTLRSAATHLLHSVKGATRTLADLAAALAQPFVGSTSSDENSAESSDDDDADEPSPEVCASFSAESDSDDSDTDVRPPRAPAPFNAHDVMASSSPAFAVARRMASRKRLPSYQHLFPQEDEEAKATPIEGHGLIGNCHTTALISTDATIAWYCYPHHDSPSIFHSMLDAAQGGSFKITAGREVARDASYVTTKQLYHTETNVLLTRFFTDSGVGHVTDYMCIGETAMQLGAKHWLVRELEVVRGKMYFNVECTPSFNYGRSQHAVNMLPHGALFVSDGLSMLLTSSKQRIWKPTSRGGVKTKVTLEEGQRVVFVLREWKEQEEKRKWEEARRKEELMERQRTFLQEQLAKLDLTHEVVSGHAASPASSRAVSHGPSATPSTPSFKSLPPIQPPMGLPPPCLHVPQSATFGLHTIKPVSTRMTDKLRKHTLEYWSEWVSYCPYEGRWREVMRRSALLLKLLTFKPTGAIIQAPTCCQYSSQVELRYSRGSMLTSAARVSMFWSGLPSVIGSQSTSNLNSPVRCAGDVTSHRRVLLSLCCLFSRRSRRACGEPS
jgi:hypothetical protein